MKETRLLGKIKIDIKTLILIITTTCIMAGFYYTTEARLDSVEREMLFLNRQIHTLKTDNKRLNRMIIRNSKKGKSKSQ